MNPQNARLGRLQEMLRLEEKRVALQEQLDSITTQMEELREGLLTSDDTMPSLKMPRAKAPTKVAKPQARGELKEQILAALASAGAQGVRVVDLAKALGTKPVNIHSWFHSTMKRNNQIRKVAGGHYRLKGSESSASPAREESGGTERKSPTRSSAAKGKKSGAQKGTRGVLQGKILASLKEAGGEGIAVQDLAQKIGVSPKNVHVWFATTGKKNPKIRKVGRGAYKIVR